MLVILVTFNIFIMIKVSELAGRFAAIQSTIGSIATKVDALIAAQGDPAIPADAEATLVSVEGALTSLESRIPPPPTP